MDAPRNSKTSHGRVAPFHWTGEEMEIQLSHLCRADRWNCVNEYVQKNSNQDSQQEKHIIRYMPCRCRIDLIQNI